MLCLDENAYPDLKKLYDRGIENGVKDLQILNRDEVLSMEPNVSDKVYAALYAPTAGIVCPFHMTIAFAENAYTNGVSFHLIRKCSKLNEMQKDGKSQPAEENTMQSVLSMQPVYMRIRSTIW